MSDTPTASRRILRFRLRTLLIATAVAACAMAGPAWYDGLYRAKVTRLTDAEARTLRLFGATPVRPLAVEEIEQPNERFVAEYRPRFRSVSLLAGFAQRSQQLVNYSARFDSNRAEVKTQSAETLERFFTAFQQADTADPQAWVLRGVLVDAANRPVAGAIVDLTGDYQIINGCRARDDGTFFHALDFAGNPANQVYRSRFRIRDFDGQWRYTSPSFTLTGGEVMQVRVTLPKAVAHQQLAPPHQADVATPATGR